MINVKLFNCCKDSNFPAVPEVKTLESCCADVRVRFHGKFVNAYGQDNESLSRSVWSNIYDDREGNKCFVLKPGARACIPTGWRMLIPHGHQVKLVPRSGMALKHGITLINSPGTIDSDYTDELMVILHNTSSVPYVVEEGDSIAQMEVTPNFMKETKFEVIADEKRIECHKGESDRNGGFGHTGR